MVRRQVDAESCKSLFPGGYYICSSTCSFRNDLAAGTILLLRPCGLRHARIVQIYTDCDVNRFRSSSGFLEQLRLGAGPGRVSTGLSDSLHGPHGLIGFQLGSVQSMLGCKGV